VADEENKIEGSCAYIIDMAQWIQEGDDNIECRPCLLPPLIQWYCEELQERGLNDLVDVIKKAVEIGDPLKIAKKFDAIKEVVSDELKERLKEFDCHAQFFKPENNGK